MSDSAPELDLKRYINLIWKRKLIIFLVTLAAVAGSAGISFFVLSPVYETKVTLFVSGAVGTQQPAVSSSDSSVAETVSRIPAMTLNTYMNQIISPYMLDRVVGALQTPNLGAGSLGSMVSAQVLKDTSLIEIRVRNTDKSLAVRIANTIASEFVEFVSEMNQERMAKSLAFLTEQETILRLDLQAAYDKLGAIQAKPDNASSLDRDISTRNQVIVKLREDLASQQGDVARLDTELRQINKQIGSMPATVPGDDGSTDVANPAYQALVSARTQTSMLLASASARASVTAQEISSLERSVTSLEAKLASAESEETVARADVDRLESTLNLLSSKIAEAQMAHSLNLGETSISTVSPAMEPVNPVRPKKMMNVAVAGVLGGFVSLLLVFALDFVDNTLKTQADVQKYLNLATLGAIPLVVPGKHNKS